MPCEVQPAVDAVTEDFLGVGDTILAGVSGCDGWADENFSMMKGYDIGGAFVTEKAPVDLGHVGGPDEDERDLRERERHEAGQLGEPSVERAAVDPARSGAFGQAYRRRHRVSGRLCARGG